MFQVEVTKKIAKKVKVNISTEKERFCQLYARDPKIIGDAIACYKEAYKELDEVKDKQWDFNMIKRKADELLMDPIISDRINQLIAEDGFNDSNVDRQHLFLLNQLKDFPTKMKAIQEYNKLKKRTDNSVTIVLPRPIMDLDDDEVIHKIDKSQAIEIDEK